MKTLEIQDIYKINALTKAIERNILLQQQLEKTVTPLEVIIKTTHNTILVNSFNSNLNPTDNAHKQRYHEITQDYLATLRVHTNTLMQRDQEELFQLLKNKQEIPNQLYQVKLQTIGAQRLMTIKTIILFTDTGLKKAKQTTDNLPCIIEKELTLSVAQQFIKELMETGATASYHKI